MLKKLLNISIATVTMLTATTVAQANTVEAPKTELPVELCGVKDAKDEKAAKAAKAKLSLTSADKNTCLNFFGSVIASSSAKLDGAKFGGLSRSGDADFGFNLESKQTWGKVKSTVALTSGWDNKTEKFNVELDAAKVEVETTYGNVSFGRFSSPFKSFLEKGKYFSGAPISDHLSYSKTLDNKLELLAALEFGVKKDGKEKAKYPVLVAGAKMPFTFAKDSMVSKVTAGVVTSVKFAEKENDSILFSVVAGVSADLNHGVTAWGHLGYRNGKRATELKDFAKTAKEFPYGQWNNVVYVAAGVGYKFSDKLSGDLSAVMATSYKPALALDATYKLGNGMSLTGGAKLNTAELKKPSAYVKLKYSF